MSDSCIFLQGPDGSLKRMNESPYLTEADLQELLAQYPDLLAGDQIDSEAPRRWLLVGREVGIATSDEGGSAFALDHLFLDQDAVPTLVEVKRSSDTRIRREVVGQMLDYAANASAYWNPESLRARFEARCEQSALDPQEELAELLSDEADYTGFWQKLEANLAVHRLRLIFVADSIPAELRRVIEFLNAEMEHIEVLGVEIKQYRDGDSKALVPRVVGQTEKPRPPEHTTQSKFLAKWGRTPEIREAYQQILAFAGQTGLIVFWGSRGFSLNVQIGSKRVSVLQGFPPDTYGGDIYSIFGGIRVKVAQGEAIAQQYRTQILELPGTSESPKGVRIAIDTISGEITSQLLDIVDRVRKTIIEHGLAPTS